MIRIAIDLMGSDLGCNELGQAVLQYLKETKDSHVLLFGDADQLKPIFSSLDPSRYEIRPTTSVIPMEIKPLDFLRAKSSSLYQAIDAVRSGEADGVLTAGSTGGLVTGASMLLRNIDGVGRSGLCTPFPTAILDKGAVILDVGANNVNTAEDLYGFARMGRIYCQQIMGEENPNCYLLSNGTEEGKGTEEIIGAYQLMKSKAFPGFMGNAEARNVLDGKHDLIITGGFAGNVFLKSTEGMASIMNSLIKSSFKRNLFTKIGYLFSHKGFDQMKKVMNYRRYGGAILLGVNGVSVKAHGNSNTLAFYQAIKVCDKMVRSDIIGKIKKEFASQHD